MKRAIGILLLCCAAISGCATTDLPAVTSSPFAIEEDERMLWKQAAEEELRIVRSGFLYEDPDLDAYLNAIAKKLLPPAVFERLPIRIRVIRNVHLNAFAMPNGTIFLHTGILARMENEAQLATLIAHEMTHSTHRHAVKGYRDLKNKTAFAATLGSLTGGLGALFGGIGAMAAVTGYSRELESEADDQGLELMIRAGYDPAEAPRLFSHLIREIEAEKIREPFFFGTHPRLQERIDHYESLLKTKGTAGGVRNAEEWQRQIRGVLLDNAVLEMRAGRFPGALAGLRRYAAAAPGDARGYYLLGEVHRQGGEKDGVERAVEAYERAASLNPAFPEPHKGLGLVYYKQGDRGRAGESIRRYLQLAPEAPDKAYMLQYLKSLEEGNPQ